MPDLLMGEFVRAFDSVFGPYALLRKEAITAEEWLRLDDCWAEIFVKAGMQEAFKEERQK